MLVLDFICTFILFYFLVSLIWPHLGSGRAAADRKHGELLEAIARLEQQKAPTPPPPPQPTFNSAERARIIALGRIRDGANRHPILDSPWVSVANADREHSA
jgi:hypothetical protein